MTAISSSFYFTVLVVVVVVVPGLFVCLCSAQPTTSTVNSSCPLNLDVLRRLTEGSTPADDVLTQCELILRGLRLVQSEYLLRTNSFIPPAASAEACWKAYQVLFNQFDIRSTCGFQTNSIVRACQNIKTKEHYEDRNSNATLNAVVQACNQSLHNYGPCSMCIASIYSLQPSDVEGERVGNVSECLAFKAIYAAAFANSNGPTNRDTAECLFALTAVHTSTPNRKQKIVLISVFLVLGFLLLVLGSAGFWYWLRRMLQI